MSASAAEWARLMNQARVKLIGASDAALKGELFDVMQEFFDASSGWLETLTVNVLANVTTYDLVTTEGQAIRIVGVAEVDPSDLSKPPHPRGAVMPNIGQIVLTEVPGANTTYKVTVAKNVTLPTDTNGFPIVADWTLSVYSTSILDGLLGQMMSMPNKSYSNSSMGVYHLKKFNAAITQLRVATLRANAMGTQAWVYPQTFSTHSQRGGVSVGSDTSFKA
jgi:hypothetical protein